MTGRAFTLLRRGGPAGLIVAVALAMAGPGAAVAGSSYSFDKTHTEIRVSWSHFGLSRQSAHFLDYDGEVVFDEGEPENSTVSVTIKPASVSTRIPAFDDHMKSADFFDVGQHGEIRFTSKAVKRTGERTGQVVGDLTIKGITRPVTLDVTFNYGGAHPLAGAVAQYKDVTVAGFSARATLRRSDFDMGLFAPGVSDEVEIVIETELHQTSG